MLCGVELMVNETAGAQEFYQIFNKSYQDELTAIGKFNLAIIGDVGSGKSSLVNAVFGLDLARTGVGLPVTPEIMGFEGPPSSRLRIFDTPGFEVGQSTDKLIAGLKKLIEDRRKTADPEQIHAVWFVINQNSHRIQPGHVKIIHALAELKLRPLLVLTHVELRAGSPQRSAVRLAEEISALSLPLGASGKIFLVNSVVEEDSPTPRHGLAELVNATLGQVPMAARMAFKVAQIVDLRLKREVALKHLKWALPAAFAAGAVPVPLVDMAALMAVHASMLAKISAAYGLSLTRAQLTKLAALTAVIGGSAAVASKKAAATAAEWAGKATAEETAKLAARKAAEIVAEEAGKEAARVAARKGAEIVAEEVAKEAGKQAARQAGKRGVLSFLGKAAPGINIGLAVFNGTLCVGITTAVAYAWMKACEEILKKPELFATLGDLDVVALYNSFFQRRKSQPPTDDDLDDLLDGA